MKYKINYSNKINYPLTDNNFCLLLGSSKNK